MQTVSEESPRPGQVVWVWLDDEWVIAGYVFVKDTHHGWTLLGTSNWRPALAHHIWTPARPPVSLPGGR